MLLGRAVSEESFFQHYEIGNFVYFEYAPIGETSRTALASGLIAEEARASVLHSVVVRFDDSRLALVTKAHLAAHFYRIKNLVVKIRKFITDDQPWAVLGDWIVLRHLTN